MKHTVLINLFLSLLVSGCNYPFEPTNKQSASIVDDSVVSAASSVSTNGNSTNTNSANSCSNMVVDHNPGVYNTKCTSALGKYASCTSPGFGGDCYECMLPSRALINTQMAPIYYTLSTNLVAGDNSTSDLAADDFQVYDYASAGYASSSACSNGLMLVWNSGGMFGGGFYSFITVYPIKFDSNPATTKKITLNKLNLSICETATTTYGCLYKAPANAGLFGVYNISILHPVNKYLVIRIGEPPPGVTTNPNTGNPN